MGDRSRQRAGRSRLVEVDGFEQMQLRLRFRRLALSPFDQQSRYDQSLHCEHADPSGDCLPMIGPDGAFLEALDGSCGKRAFRQSPAFQLPGVGDIGVRNLDV